MSVSSRRVLPKAASWLKESSRAALYTPLAMAGVSPTPLLLALSTQEIALVKKDKQVPLSPKNLSFSSGVAMFSAKVVFRDSVKNSVSCVGFKRVLLESTILKGTKTAKRS